jgi:hypothetical protein
VDVTHRRAVLSIAALALLAGTSAAWHYSSEGLALSHYDARAHLVVSRRILDSLMPGWQQIGAVWLPLPHALNALPVQVDAWYRSGASATALSVLSMSAAVGALASLIVRATGSVIAALAGAALIMSNPNTLYLQSTPMTEPMLLGTALLSIALTAAWLDSGAGTQARAPGLALAATCMTRYEGWPIAAALILLTAALMLRRGAGFRATLLGCGRLAAYPAAAIVLFIANSRWTVGSWFVSAGFFVAENEALGRPGLAWEQVQEGLYKLSGTATVWPAWVGLGLLIWAFARSRTRGVLVLVVSLLAAVVLPWYAFLQGHPFRIRYCLPLVAACAVITASGIAVLDRRVRGVAAVAVVTVSVLQASPFDRSAALIAEAQRDSPNMMERRTVTAFLREHYDGRLIMMSMGSLAHYMQELSHAGFHIRDFLHEGNGEIWQSAAGLGPQHHVGWVVVEERAEGGDDLFKRAQRDPQFLDGFERVAEGGGIALYRAIS